MSEGATRKAIEAIWRIESARLICGLVRVVRDVDLAEDLAQEALVTALERWPETGIPDKPGAWLMATAKNRAIDQLRRRRMVERKHGAIAETGASDSLVTPDLAGTSSSFAEDLQPLRVPRASPARWVPTPSRRPSPPATDAPPPERRPTGSGSSPSTTRSSKSRNHPSWS